MSCCISAVAFASDNSIFSPIYVGIFGGGGSINDIHLQQRGTALYGAAAGGPLVVNAQGPSRTDSIWLAGIHIGYRWLQCQKGNQWNLVPAAELEGYYLGNFHETGILANPTTRVPEHTFVDSFPLNTGVLLVNAVFIINTPYMTRVRPYVGIGAGTARLAISGAHSARSTLRMWLRLNGRLTSLV